MQKSFCIYGDNIVECERMIHLISEAISPSSISISGNPTAPSYIFTASSGTLNISTFPGFGRWENDIIKHIRNSGGALREAPDIILTKHEGDFESPMLAIEFCSALPAGNQAWQRSGRAYSTVKAGIPYIFITEIGGYELDDARNKKAPRMPNPAVPFSYFSYAGTSASQISIAYQMNPGADHINKATYENSICGKDFSKYLRSFLLGGDKTIPFQNLQNHLLDFVSKLSSKQKTGHLNASDWADIAKSITSTNSASLIINKSNFPWKKKISIPTTKTFKRMFEAGRMLCSGVASCDLPISILPKTNIKPFFAEMQKAYGSAVAKFSQLNSTNTDIAICWYAGFKPRGDDARPDRGVLPLARMLLGDNIPILTFMYGPATHIMLKLLEETPDILQKSNGLWEATLSLSDYVVCDATTGEHPVLQLGTMSKLRKQRSSTVLMPANTIHFPKEASIGENDVDSIIHLIFTAILNDSCFEMMCNPPGGDWSGISLQCEGKEFRWLTLPRVSASAYKRPDHVIQIGPNTIFSIESKDFLCHLERDIGPRLNGYCKELFTSKPSCWRKLNDKEWSDQTDDFSLPELKYVSASAFILSNESDMSRALSSAKTDVVFGVQFRRKDYTPIILISMAPTIDKNVKRILESLCNSSHKNSQTNLQLLFELKLI